jgi:hypothetical protein
MNMTRGRPVELPLASISVLKSLPDLGKDVLFLQGPCWGHKGRRIGVSSEALYDDLWTETFQKAHNPIHVRILI